VILLVDNYDSFTYNLAHLFAEQGAEVVVRRNDEIDANEAERLAPSHLVVSPGPGRPSDSGETVAIIQRLAPRVPTLGVCLGHQAIVEAFGGEIGAAQSIVHGKAAAVSHDGLGIFRGLPDGFEAGRYHSLAATLVPEELEVSATTADGEVMAVRHRELWIDGVQFHPESVLTPLGPSLAKNFLEAAGTSASWDAAGGAGPEGTVPTSTGPESTVPSAASGGGGAGLRPAGAVAGQGREA
jgi:anthranilate synthase component II